ncbi:MAG: hypothetical protein UX13_C0020G0006 [Candidatus Woesebacteria bacterium GW2011_GWB1_45_5]|uniref:DUF2723 domain-containing protein n=1 Tax=Candidatus Woesebacteria bacterium GW2011_GWB1_45_5 TaxID=1618581 RepID=A0A0G1MPN0_9BACT|nr:MAG: hypothetical protein UX13_C0020G0006 [Candidatus Woesebacteria bacterium GW2011_GWB1_45_5]
MDKQIRMGKFLIICLFVPLAIYLKTLLPTVGFWDTAEFQTIPYTFDIGHPTGYPTYIVIGKIFLSVFNFNSVAWRMNFLSALFVSFGIYLFSLSLYRLTRKLSLSLVLALLLSVNPHIWSVAVAADPHALHFLFTSLFIFLGIKILNDKRNNLLPLASFVCGLSLGNHMLSVFFLPSLLFLAVNTIKDGGSVKILFLSFLSFVLGGSIYFLLPILSVTKVSLLNINYSLATIEGFKRHVFGEDFQGLMNTWAKGGPAVTLSFYFDLVKESFPYYLWIFIPAGFLATFLKFPRMAVFLALIFFPTLAFSMRYQNAVIERYFLTSFSIEAIWLAVFIDRITRKSAFHLVSVAVILFLSLTIFVNYKGEIDQSKNFYAYTWASGVLNSTDKDGVVFSWWSYSTPLWYLQKVENVRSDVLIVNANKHEWEGLAESFVGKRPVYFIEEVSLSGPGLRLVKEGGLYRIVSTHF